MFLTTNDAFSVSPYTDPGKRRQLDAPRGDRYHGHTSKQEVAMKQEEQLEGRYARLYSQLRELIEQTESRTSRMATIAALLHHKIPHFFWTGFYLLKRGELCVGPYQGPLACQILKQHQGVCWTGILERRTVIVPDVEKFPGHWACDSRSKSEIVVPFTNRAHRIAGVLDVDSRQLDAFSSVDREWLEKIVRLIPGR